MFKQLFARIKSEKTKSSISSKQQIQQCYEIKPENAKVMESFFEQYTLPELKLIETVPTVHYGVLDGFPDLTASILACGIPFVNLRYANRRVKEISTIEHPNLPYYAEYFLKTFKEQLHQPNHFLINDYPIGVGIMPHLDGPAYYPKVVVYSIGTVIIKFVKKGETQRKLLLQDKSIHIFQGQAYTQYMHGIQDHGIDCIFFQIKEGKIINASVDNFQETSIYSKLLLLDLSDLPQSLIGDYELSKIHNNEQYTHKLSIPRRRRISVTIRHKYQ